MGQDGPVVWKPNLPLFLRPPWTAFSGSGNQLPPNSRTAPGLTCCPGAPEAPPQSVLTGVSVSFSQA